MAETSQPSAPASDEKQIEYQGKRTSYDEFEIGTEFAPYEWSLTTEQVELYCIGHEEYHEWYSVDSPFGGRVCPPVMNYRPARNMFSAQYNVRGLLYEYETENINPIKPDVKMRVTGRISGKWKRNDREFVEYQVTCADDEGREIFRSRRVHVLNAAKRKS